MGHNNYSNFSKHNNQSHQHQVDVPSFVEDDRTTVDNEPENIVEEIKQEATGKVIDCDRLNVRKEDKKESDVLCIIEKDSEVQINLDESTEEFYKVVTPSGIEGYCMKKFIEVK